jgi:hypothetical protein
MEPRPLSSLPNRWLLVALPFALVGCFGDEAAPNEMPDGALSADAEGSLDASIDAGDATILDATLHDSGEGQGDAAADGGRADAAVDASFDAPRCTVSTCTSAEVVFHSWIAGDDGGPEWVEVAVDQGTPDGGPNGTVIKTASATDPALGHQTLLVGNFVTTDDAGTLASPLEYASDNNACDLPFFAQRMNAYYLAPAQGLPIDPSWFSPQCGCGGGCGGPCLEGGTGGACDYESLSYSQTCPNFGSNCVVTPRKIESIQVIATSADATCEVCLYNAPTPSDSGLLRCIAPGATLSRTDLYGTGGDASTSTPRLLLLDDGSHCASY